MGTCEAVEEVAAVEVAALAPAARRACSYGTTSVVVRSTIEPDSAAVSTVDTACSVARLAGIVMISASPGGTTLLKKGLTASCALANALRRCWSALYLASRSADQPARSSGFGAAIGISSRCAAGTSSAHGA